MARDNPLHVPRLPRVKSHVIRSLAVLCALAGSVLLAAAPKTSLPKVRDARLDSVLHAVEERYNSAHTLTVHFTEEYEAGKRVRQTEWGVLELRKPGKMRWDYALPAGKLFLSDGKRFYLYNPSTQRVQITSARDADDMHAPLAFLLGRLNFYKEFTNFELHGEGSDVWIETDPNSATLPYSKVEFLIAPDSRIRRLRVTEDDLSILDFTFEDEKRNTPLPPERFVFQMPAGAEIDDSTQ
jgi:outer membrane lipoprotein carrier protein